MRRLLALVVVALAVVAFVVLTAPESEAPDDASQGEAPVPQCAAEDPILTLDSFPAEHGKGRHRSPEQAIQDEVTQVYPKLSPQAFKQKRSNSRAEFAHERNGRAVATAVVEQVGDGWETEIFSACNSVLVDARRGGQP